MSEVPDLAKPENAYERDLPPLHEFYIPVVGRSGEVTAVFEVYRLKEHIESTVGDVRRYVWVSVGVAIGLLGLFIAILILANGRAITRRRWLTEKLFGDLVQSQAEERSRIIGLMHDDIGQSLYRIHYGIEDMKARADGAMIGELDHIGNLVSQVDGLLRAELRLLEYGTGEELALGSALDELAEVTEMESDLTVSVKVEPRCDLSPTGRVALFRAAREAVTNVRKHALASSVQISAVRKGSNVRLEVLDDGVGMASDEGLGLTTTRERLEAIGGGLRVREDRKGGTRFTAWLPADSSKVKQ
jgi:signal transduction histidine kinase